MKHGLVVIFILMSLGCVTPPNHSAQMDQMWSDLRAGRITSQEFRQGLAEFTRENREHRDRMAAKWAGPLMILGAGFTGTPGHGRVWTKTVSDGHGGFTTTYTTY
jgi:hypothetical protein